MVATCAVIASFQSVAVRAFRVITSIGATTSLVITFMALKAEDFLDWFASLDISVEHEFGLGIPATFLGFLLLGFAGIVGPRKSSISSRGQTN